MSEGIPKLSLSEVTTDIVRAAASGGILALAFPPFDSPAGLLGLALLLYSVFVRGTLRRAFMGWIAGVAFFSISLWWITLFGWYALTALVVFQALFISAFAVLAPMLLNRNALIGPFAVAGLWSVLELLRGSAPFGGFPWITLGSSLHDVAVARNLAGLIGTSGLSALIIVVATFLVLLLPGRTRRILADRGSLSRTRASAGLAAVALVTAFLALLPRANEPSREVRIALVQAGIETPWYEPADPNEILSRHVEVTRSLRGHKLDLVMWGENVVEGGAPLEVVLEVAREIGTPLSSGVVEEGPNMTRQLPRRGSSHRKGWLNLVVAADPERGFIGRYAKQQPVPFGEYVPLRPLLGRIPVLAKEVPFDMERGLSTKVFRYAFGATAPVISYESAFPGIARKGRLRGAKLLEVHTNNSSFGRSPASEQHLALDQMRAAELGVPVARSAISGISALIDASGEVVARLELYETGTVVGTVSLPKGTTPYARFGDWMFALPLTMLAAIRLSGAAILRLRRARPE